MADLLNLMLLFVIGIFAVLSCDGVFRLVRSLGRIESLLLQIRNNTHKDA